MIQICKSLKTTISRPVEMISRLQHGLVE